MMRPEIAQPQEIIRSYEALIKDTDDRDTLIAIASQLVGDQRFTANDKGRTRTFSRLMDRLEGRLQR